MTTAQQQFNDYATQQLETLLGFARISMDAAERMVKLQVETAKNTLEDSARNAKEFTGISNIKDAQSVFATQQKRSESVIDNSITYARSLHEITSQAQTEFSKLLDERSVFFNKKIVSGLDRFVKSAPAGTDPAVATVKLSVQATAAAVDSLTKVAKQVADFADTSMKAASIATVDAVKAATKKANSSIPTAQ